MAEINPTIFTATHKGKKAPYIEYFTFFRLK